MVKKNKKSNKSSLTEEKKKEVHTDDALDLSDSIAPDFPIVGIGASAGGLAAFEGFFAGLPVDKDPDMAFVLVQHLAPDHKSILTDLIKRYTRMNVYEVEDGQAVKKNCTYIIPPNFDMALMNGKLHLLTPNAPRGQRFPIDFFFQSLAQDQHEKSICVILSGSGSDGTEGARAIKNEDGMVIVQSPDSTEYDGMPRSAISAGLSDFILPLAEIGPHLMAYSALAFGKSSGISPVSDAKSDEILEKIYILLRAHTGHDFSLYKKNTIKRRVERRMAAHQLTEVNDYLRYLQQNPLEIEALFRDVLIGVTNFFRDPEAFAALESEIIPGFFAERPVESPIRVWVPACSTGEEAYSIAILLQEKAAMLKKNYKIQVFATDIDQNAISCARAGIYPASISVNVSPERLARYFSLESDGISYRINKSIRDMLIFSEQNAIKDPPFSKLDLISCRNMMIYMGRELQKRIIPMFHYSLNPGGILFLGSSESVGDFLDLFTCLDRKHKLYKRNDNSHVKYELDFRKFPLSVQEARVTPFLLGKSTGEKPSLRNLTEGLLLDQYAPVGVLVNERGVILYIHGRSGSYLEPVQGEPDMNILKMARDGLRRDLTIALHQAMTEKKKVHRAGLQIQTNGDFCFVNLTIQPVSPALSGTPLYMVILENVPVSEHFILDKSTALESNAQHEDSAIIALKQELRAKEEYLQSANEELATSNEELKSSNEEMLSINEELQSTYEEMETSREELQSVNEELATVNNELQTKVTDLSRVNSDLNNLLAATDIGTIFLDKKFTIQRFTPSVSKIINLISTDVGRPVADIVFNLVGYDRLLDDVKDVLDTMNPKETEVETKNGSWYLLRIRPYKTLENVIDGATVTFVDINEIKRAQYQREKIFEELKKTQEIARLSIVVNDASDAIIVHDLEGLIIVFNPQAEKMYGWTKAEALKMKIWDMTPSELRQETMRRIQQLSQSEILESYHTKRYTKNGQNVDVWLTATALFNQSNNVYGIVTTERLYKKNNEGKNT